MDIFNKAKESISMAGKGFTQKASDVSGIARVSMKIREEEKEIQEIYKKLGEQFYMNYPDELTKMFPEEAFNLDNLNKQIAKDKQELSILKGMCICPNCGSEQEKEALCCTACGINLEDARRMQMAQQPETIFCKNCGKAITADTKFCMNCGTKVE